MENIKKVLSSVVILSMVFSLSGVFPAISLAQENNDEQEPAVIEETVATTPDTTTTQEEQEEIIEKEEDADLEEPQVQSFSTFHQTDSTGSMRICKIILDAEGKVITGDTGTTFTIPGSDPDNNSGTASFTTPLSLNAKILSDSDSNDAKCYEQTGVKLGLYHYGEEEISPDASLWLSPRYSDIVGTSLQPTLTPEDFSTFGNGEIYGGIESDGNVTLTEETPDRTVVVLNQLKKVEGPQIPPGDDPFSCIEGENEGWYATYYDYSRTDNGMNLPENEWSTSYGAPLTPGDDSADWYDSSFAKFSQVDSDLMFGPDFFPMDYDTTEVDSGHNFHFGAHWSAKVTPAVAGNYGYELSSDDDAWIYVNGVLVVDNSGVHPAEEETGMIALTAGENIVDIYFAERHTVASEMSFKFVDDLNILPNNPECDQPETPETSTVTVCKVGDNQQSLPGWTLMLEGDEVQTGLNVPSTNSSGVNSNLLTSGASYIAKVVGTWMNQGSANTVDAEYSTTDGWATQMDGYTGYQTDILELQIDNSFDPNSTWGPYNSAHTYARSFTPAGTSANFRIFDGTGATQDESWFADNSGSLDVDINKGYAGVTGENGCIVFPNVPYGNYNVNEINQAGWTNVSGLEEVVVNSPTEAFTVVNHFGSGPSCDETAETTVVSDTSTINTTDGNIPAVLLSPTHLAWTASIPGASWIWATNPVVGPTNDADLTKVFTRTFTIVGTPTAGTLDIAADNTYSVKVNGNFVGSELVNGNTFASPNNYNILPFLASGINTIEITVTNWEVGQDADPAANPAGLLYKISINNDECHVPPPADVCPNLEGDQSQVPGGYEIVDNQCIPVDSNPSDSTVTIVKYIQEGENQNLVAASAVNTTSSAFPLTATWNASNIGSGSGSFALGPVGFNNPNAYQATTSEMTDGASYSVVENLGTTCGVENQNQYVLVGYKTGNTLSGALASSIVPSASLTNITTNKYIVVINKKCGEVQGATTIKVHIQKYLNGSLATNESAGGYDFPMTATWTTANLNGGAQASAGYTLGTNFGGATDIYGADTAPMEVPADYTTSEITDETSNVLPIGATCAAGKYRLLGYKSSEIDFADANAQTTMSSVAPSFNDLDNDAYVIVYNEKCSDDPIPPTCPAAYPYDLNDNIGAITFEAPTYNVGSVNGQDGWSAIGVYDSGIIAQSTFPSFEQQSFRISNAITSGSFGDQAFAKPLTNAAGETTATAGTFSVGNKQGHFEAEFDIASVDPCNEQPGLSISVSPDRGDGSRMSYLRFDDTSLGLDVFFYDVQGTTNPANFVQTQVADNLNRSIPHTVQFVMDFIDGPSNDEVKVYIDGSLVHTGTSWENYYRFDSESSSEQTPRITKTLLFRAGGTAVPANSGDGFLFDNITLSSSGGPNSCPEGQHSDDNQCVPDNNGGNDPVGSIQITKYVCPEGTQVTRTVNGVGLSVPSGCVPQANMNFGYVHGTGTDANAPYNDVLGPTPTEAGVTNGSGVLTIPNLPATGRYLVMETDGANNQLPSSEILGLYCVGDGDTSGNNDNQELTFVSNGGTALCVAYNEADVLGETSDAHTTVVRAADLAANVAAVIAAPTKWFFYNDETDVIDNNLGTFVTGPGSPLIGTGSSQMSVTGTQRRNIATYQFSNILLSNITSLNFSTYSQSVGNGAGPNAAPYLHFNVDFNGSDTFQRRLVYVPSENGSVVDDTWQTWNAVTPTSLWLYSGTTWPAPNAIPGTSAKTWAQILSDYPGIKTRTTDSWFGFRVGEPYPAGFTGNVDNVVIGIKTGLNTHTETYDFEPTNVSVDTSCDDDEHLSENECVPNEDSEEDPPNTIVNRNTNDDGHIVSYRATSLGGSGQVLGAESSCGIYVDKFLKKGHPGNNPEAVKAVQTFLNNYTNAGLVVDGVFGTKTEIALKAFQLAHKDKILDPWHIPFPTGLFYITTQTEVNNIMCPELKLPIPGNLTPWTDNLI